MSFAIDKFTFKMGRLLKRTVSVTISISRSTLSILDVQYSIRVENGLISLKIQRDFRFFNWTHFN